MWTAEEQAGEEGAGGQWPAREKQKAGQREGGFAEKATFTSLSLQLCPIFC